MNYRRWAFALGDLNADGMADLILARVGGSSSSQVTFVPGTNTGLANGAPFNLTASLVVRAGDSRFVSVRLADITGSGHPDILIINDNAEQGDSGQIEFSMHRARFPTVEFPTC